MVDDFKAMQDIWKQLPDWLKNLNARFRTIWSEIHEDIVPQDYFKTENETSFFHKDGICYMVERSSLYQLYSKIRFGKKNCHTGSESEKINGTQIGNTKSIFF